jgi:hypothetical protein
VEVVPMIDNAREIEIGDVQVKISVVRNS